jgi:hypothetical protein
MANLRPSEVRALMLQNLDGLRTSLDDLARAAESDKSRLRACAVDLRERLRAFRELEDSVLARALEQTDFWGPKRLETMKREHAPHWTAVVELASAADQPDADLAALALRANVVRCELRRGLDEEERCLLIAEVFQDDVTSTDQSDG